MANEKRRAEGPVTVQIEEATRDDVDAREEEEELDGDESDSIIDDSSDEAGVEEPRRSDGGEKRPRQRLPLSHIHPYLDFTFGQTAVGVDSPAVGRKRPSKELEPDVEMEGEGYEGEVESDVRESGREAGKGIRKRSGSPPKRIKVDGSFSDASTPSSNATPSIGTATTVKVSPVRGIESPTRMRKRSSEELEDDPGSGEAERFGNGEKKRQRSDSSILYIPPLPGRRGVKTNGNGKG